MFDSFRGNEHLIQELTYLVSSGKMPHGIAIQSEIGQGGGFFSKLLAQTYLDDQNDLVLRGIHPDCIMIEGSGSSGDISVQTVRDALYEANKAAVTTEGKRVVLIQHAEHLNQSSSNALLKMLEEPPQGVVFILTVKDKYDLLETILSRVSLYRLQSPDIEECVEEVLRLRKECTEKQAYELAVLFDGRIGLALRSFEDNSFAEMAIAGREFCKSAMNADIYGMMSSMSVADEREKMKQLLHTSVLYLRSRTRETKTHVAKEEMILDEVSKAYEEVAKYTNMKLLQTRMSYVIGNSKNGN